MITDELGVGTRIDNDFAAQWLAYTLPYRRFADVLADACARIGGRRGLLLVHRSGLSPHTPRQSPGALTRVAACTLARSPIRDSLPEGFSHFVASMTAPVASGGSEIAGWAFHPLERCRLSTAHTQSRRSLVTRLHRSLKSKANGNQSATPPWAFSE